MSCGKEEYPAKLVLIDKDHEDRPEGTVYIQWCDRGYREYVDKNLVRDSSSSGRRGRASRRDLAPPPPPRAASKKKASRKKSSDSVSTASKKAQPKKSRTDDDDDDDDVNTHDANENNDKKPAAVKSRDEAKPETAPNSSSDTKEATTASTVARNEQQPANKKPAAVKPRDEAKPETASSSSSDTKEVTSASAGARSEQQPATALGDDATRLPENGEASKNDKKQALANTNKKASDQAPSQQNCIDLSDDVGDDYSNSKSNQAAVQPQDMALSSRDSMKEKKSIEENGEEKKLDNNLAEGASDEKRENPKSKIGIGAEEKKRRMVLMLPESSDEEEEDDKKRPGSDQNDSQPPSKVARTLDTGTATAEKMNGMSGHECFLELGRSEGDNDQDQDRPSNSSGLRIVTKRKKKSLGEESKDDVTERIYEYAQEFFDKSEKASTTVGDIIRQIENKMNLTLALKQKTAIQKFLKMLALQMRVREIRPHQESAASEIR